MCSTREETSPADTVHISLDILTCDNINQRIFATGRQKIQITVIHWRKILLFHKITGSQKRLHTSITGQLFDIRQQSSAFLI